MTSPKTRTAKEPSRRGTRAERGLRPDLTPGDRQLLGNPKTRAFAELLIDCEEDRTLRAVLVGMPREDNS
jgi:hypothetical protein